MIPDLRGASWLTLHGIVTAVGVLVYVFTTHALRQRRQPTAAIAWILFIVSLPYLALPAFLAFGSRKLKRDRPERESERPAARLMAEPWAAQTLVSLHQPFPGGCHDLRVHEDGAAARAALVEIVSGARRSIDLSTYLVGRGRIAEEVIGLLAARARAGVRVRLLVDGFGYASTRPPSLEALTAAGGRLALFMPLLRSVGSGRANLRNHRKLLVTDAGDEDARLWCGGRNLSDEYFEGDVGRPAWTDLSFDVRGPIVEQARMLFERDWAFATGTAAAALTSPVAPTDCAGECAQVVASGPDQEDDTIYALLVVAAYRANERIAFATPYFVPDPELLMALCLAARRGVAVDLILPERSNHRLSDVARTRALRALVANGARVWLSGGMMHAKLAVCDDVLALCGSANFDSRSLFLNYETMVAFHASRDIGRFAEWFDRTRQGCRRYVPDEPGIVRDVAEGMLLWLGFQL